MALTHTRTYVHYWSADDLGELSLEAEKLIEEGQSRMPHVSERSREAMEHRINNLRAAIAMMGERVPE